MRRGYLSRDELNTFMVIIALIQTIEGRRSVSGTATGNDMWDDWGSRGMMTKGAQRSLKSAYTHLKKFVIEIMTELDDRTVETIEKKMEKFDYMLVSDFAMEKIRRDIKDHFKHAVIDMEIWQDIVEYISEVFCVGCKKDYRKCPLAKAYEETLNVGPEEEPNCPYACDLSNAPYMESIKSKGVDVEKFKMRVEQRKKYVKEKNVFTKE